MSSTEENQNTQTETPTPTPTPKTSKWKDPEYIKAYYRQYNRKRRTYKLHPYILEDGRRYKDVYEYPPEFESKEAWIAYKKERHRGYKKAECDIIYVPKPKKHCDLCDVDIKNGKWAGHCASIKHKKNEELLQKHGVAFNVEP